MRYAIGMAVPYGRATVGALGGARRVVAQHAFRDSLAAIQSGFASLKLLIRHDESRVLAWATPFRKYLDQPFVVQEYPTGLVATFFDPSILSIMRDLRREWGGLSLSAGWIATDHRPSYHPVPSATGSEYLNVTLKGRIHELSLVPTGAFGSAVEVNIWSD